MRRIIKEKYGFKKLYSEGLSIKSPLNIDFQVKAIKALRDGIESYDKRHGWRGPIVNKIKNKNWKKIIENKKLDPTLNWKIAEITNVTDIGVDIKLMNSEKGFIKLDNMKWAVKKDPKKSLVSEILFLLRENKRLESKQYPEINGGLVAIDPYTGDVKALVGGFSYKSSEFNRVTQAKRQPGSAFKPFVYAAALENGFLPNSIILDAPYISEQGVGLKDWKPENYGKKFYGPSTFRKGIEYSRNLMTVRIAETLGLKKILELSSKLNIYDIPELLSVSLGSAETSLLNITTAYASFVNGGKKINPNLIKRIQNRRGKTIYSSNKATCSGCDKIDKNTNELPKLNYDQDQVISEETAYQITSILSGVVDRGLAKS